VDLNHRPQRYELDREYKTLTKTVTYGTCSVLKPCSIGVHLWFTLPQSGTKLTQLERLLSSESGHTVKPFEQSAYDPKRTFSTALVSRGRGSISSRPIKLSLACIHVNQLGFGY